MNEQLTTPAIKMQRESANEGFEAAQAQTMYPDAVLLKRESFVPGEIANKLASALQNVKQVVVARDELIKQTAYALLSREHQLIYSRAGTAKSLYARSVFDQIDAAEVFSIQLTKRTPEESVVGGVIFDELKMGNQIHNVQNTLVTANLAFLDEIFDANDPTLRAMLGILNERKYDNGKQEVDARLHSAIATSNYLRNTDVTEAVTDRFVYKAYLLPESNQYNKLLIDEAYETHQEGTTQVVFPEKVHIDELNYLADIVEGKIPEKRIIAPRSILFLKNVIISQYLSEINSQRVTDQKPELYISDRTSAKTRDILNASALLHGRDTLTVEDLYALKYMVCTIGGMDNQEKVFKNALTNATSTMNPYDLQLVDLIMETSDYFKDLLMQFQRGEKMPPTKIEQIKEFFNLQSGSELTFARIKKQLKTLPTTNSMVNPLVHELRESALAYVEKEEKRIKGKGEDGLLL